MKKMTVALSALVALSPQASFSEQVASKADVVTVIAKKKENISNTFLCKGGQYQFSIEMKTPLVDGSIKCDKPGPAPDECHGAHVPLGADGFQTEYLSGWRRFILAVAKPFTPSPESNWFELICAVGKGEYFRPSLYPIGQNAFLSPEQEGKLLCKVNDFPFKYGNNEGSVEVTIVELQRSFWGKK